MKGAKKGGKMDGGNEGGKQSGINREGERREGRYGGRKDDGIKRREGENKEGKHVKNKSGKHDIGCKRCIERLEKELVPAKNTLPPLLQEAPLYAEQHPHEPVCLLHPESRLHPG